MDLLRAWWDWCSESFGHMFLGVTAPILLASAFLVLILAGGDGGSFPQPPRSDVAGVCVDASSGAAATPCASPRAATRPDGLTIDTATPVPPTPTPAPRNYVVQAGDTLSVICASELPELPGVACMELIVELSGLDGPDAIFEGQALRLPAAASPSGTRTPRGAPTTTPTPEALVEPEPTTLGEAEPTEEAEATPTATSVPAAGVLKPLFGPGEDAEASDGTESEGLPEGGEGSDGDQDSNNALVPLLGDIDVEDATLPHDFDRSNAHIYVVEAGDSILSICFEQYPDLPAVDCVGIIVALNGLGGPDEIIANQGILLP